MKILHIFLVPALVAAVHSLSAQAPATPAKPTAVIKAARPAPKSPITKGLRLKDGDRFIFIGDSITHQCLYTQYVENFFYTR
jgi:hypothetical protein